MNEPSPLPPKEGKLQALPKAFWDYALIVIFVILGAATIYSAATNLCFNCISEAEPNSPPPLEYCGAPCDAANGATCPAQFECIEGQCIDTSLCLGCGRACKTTDDCPPLSYCTDDHVCINDNLCPPFDASLCLAACESNADCSPYLRCEYGTCVGKRNAVCSECGARCDSDADCPDGLSCIPDEQSPPGSERKICYSFDLCQSTSVDPQSPDSSTSTP